MNGLFEVRFTYYSTNSLQSKSCRRELTYQHQTKHACEVSNYVKNNLFVFKLLKENLQLEFLF